MMEEREIRNIEESLRNTPWGENLTEEERYCLLTSLMVLCRVNGDFQRENKWGELFEGRRIYIEPKDRWSRIKESRDSDLRENLCRAMKAAGELGAQYKEILYPEIVLKAASASEIRFLMEAVEGAALKNGNFSEDTGLVRLWEFAEAHRVIKAAGRGEIYTPREIAGLMVAMLSPEGGTVYDPCCGSGVLLIEAARYIRERGGRFSLYGREISEMSWKIGCMNFCIRGLEVNMGTGPIDVLSRNGIEDRKFNYVLGNPPFGIRAEAEEFPNDPRWIYGKPSLKRSGFFWLQHMIYHLEEDGKLGVLLNNGILESSNSSEKRIRESLIKDNILEAIITLPAGIFYNTKISVSLWLLNKKKAPACRGKILFIDAEKLGRTEGKRKVLSSSDTDKIFYAYEKYQKGWDLEEPEFCRTMWSEDIRPEDWSLEPKRYIAYEKSELPSLRELEEEEKSLQDRLGQLLDEKEAVVWEFLDRQQGNGWDKDEK